MELICARKIVKTYRENGLEVNAVRGVSLELAQGEFTALVGPSGSGKTTLLNIIAGLDTPTEGEVLLAGCDLASMSDTQRSDFRRDHMGFIFQAYNLVPVLTVEENIEYVLLLQGVPRAERHQKVLDILNLMGLSGMENRRPPQLSGGQQQRVAIARAMASNPDLFLADVPTANLDSHTGADLLSLMHELNREAGMTFLFSTHDPMVMDKARRVVTLRDGQIQEDLRKGS